MKLMHICYAALGLAVARWRQSFLRRWLPGIVACCLLWPLVAVAQEDEPSLGDVARDLRRNKVAPRQETPIIDNDNLAQAMQDAKNRKPKVEDKFVLSI